MPGWRQGQAVGEWRQIPGSVLSSAPMLVKTYPSLGNSGPDSKVSAWTGFAIDTRDSSVYSAANGGHADYAGNEVNRIKLSDDSPQWSEPHAATSASQVLDSAYYADGRPASRHTYYGAMVNEVTNHVMLLGGARWQSGSGLSTMDGFNLASNDWRPSGTYPGMGSNYGAAIVEHKSSGDVYLFDNRNVMRWSSQTNQWSTRLSNTVVYGQYAASALDTRRNRIFVVGGNVNDQGLYSIDSNTMQSVTLSGANAGSLSGDGNGMVYDPYLDAYLLRKPGAGSTIYRINASTFAVDTLTTNAGSANPAAINGVWRRFLYAPQLKGVVYIPAYSAQMWFIRSF